MFQNKRAQPLMIVHDLSNGMLGVRFAYIGNRQKFGRLLARFRNEFILAHCEEIAGHVLWLVESAQRPELGEFARRNGLAIQEAS